MSPRIERETTVSKADGSFELRRELVADLPEISGVYETSLGTISMRICDKIARVTGLQKIIFAGEAVREKNSLRRVVKFPAYPTHRRRRKADLEIVQDISPTERFIFSRGKRRFY